MLRVGVFVFRLGCAIVVEGKLKPPGGATNREELSPPTDGCRLNEKLGVVVVVLAIKLKPLLGNWV